MRASSGVVLSGPGMGTNLRRHRLVGPGLIAPPGGTKVPVPARDLGTNRPARVRPRPAAWEGQDGGHQVTTDVGLNPLVLRRVVDVARLAPSVHNTQPWSWQVLGDALELRADPSRSLPVADPRGRNLVISCGAALHHAVVAARAMRLTATVSPLPDPGDGQLLARLGLTRGGVDRDAEEDLLAIRERCTDRRRFTSWPVPDDRVVALARSASGWGAEAVPVTDVSRRFRLETLLERARIAQATDPRVVEETRLWVDHGRLDGLPLTTVPTAHGRPGEYPHRFDPAPGRDEGPVDGRLVETSEGLVVIATERDDVAAWLSAGQTLSALWLHATREGLSLVPLSQVIEVDSTRRGLASELTEPPDEPQIVVRLGWQEISRSTLPRTPRRPLHDVLLP